MTEHAFNVDLRGIVDLLSQHLYTGPHVYVRELVQNAADALAARGPHRSAAPARIDIISPTRTHDGSLQIIDTGVGLTEADLHTLLATVGRSSKRDDLGFARQDLLGQFGIGLLSCFLIADDIVVVSRSIDGGPAVEWVGTSDGRYRTRVLADADPAALHGHGTRVTLRPRRDMHRWVEPAQVVDLVRKFADLLPLPIAVDGVVVNSGLPPWQREYRSPAERRDALGNYCRGLFGFDPLAIIDLRVPEAGLDGLAFVLPVAANPGADAGHRVYLKRMLLTESADALLPKSWSFLVRCVVDTGMLRPTAAREDLFDDDLLAATRAALGSAVREWLVKTSVTDPELLDRVLSTHHLGIKSLARHDDQMLEIVDEWLPMETTRGPATLGQLRRAHGRLTYTTTVETFREFAAIAAAADLTLINGGYVYDIDMINASARLHHTPTVEFDPARLLATLHHPDPETAAALASVQHVADGVLAETRTRTELRRFEPASVPALYLLGRPARGAREFTDARDRSTGLWSEVLGSFESSDGQTVDNRAVLVLNTANPVTSALTGIADTHLIELAVQALYGQALLAGHHPVAAADAGLLNRSFLGLLERALA
ncbi:HSP90 family protein [Gordonia sp. ABSL1-1]|uniref:HSP90 family protein n=1 Tax=Gordonia sp. ABSL1-1 TaxID=3053923 RepID=UPI002574153F|nr:HSP90 family protein [Gordonia sp. ABSL1-1]MDL9935596.1 HSP90 family protein [Gordonia sp. ABSL1-1]